MDPTTAVVLADVDGDRNLDLIVGNLNAVNRLYLNKPTGTFTLAPTSPFTTAQATTSLAVGDLNGDGAVDIVIGNNGQVNQLYLNAGTQIVAGSPTWKGFATPLSITSDTGATTSLALGDVDGDNHLDLVVGNNGTANKLYRNNGSKTDPFKDVLPVSLGETTGLVATATTSVALANIDGDHDLDLIVGNTGQPEVVYVNDRVKVTRIALSGISVTVSDQGIQNGQGAFVLTNEGIAGFVSGTISVAPAGGTVSVGGTLGARINTTSGPVDETVEVAGKTLRIKFDSPQPFTFFGSDFSLSIGTFVTVEGNFAFSSSELTGTGARVFLGDGPAFLDRDGTKPNASARGLLLSNAAFGYKKGSTAGTFAFFATGQISLLGILGVSFSGNATVKLNNTGGTQDVTFDFSPATITLPDGSVVSTVTVAASQPFEFKGDNIAIVIMGQTLSGQFAFTKNADGTFTVTLSPDSAAAADVVLNLGDGKDTNNDQKPDLFPVSVRITSGSLTLANTGLYGVVTATPTVNVPGFNLTTTVSLRINTTADPVMVNPTADPVTVGAVLIPANSVRVETGKDRKSVV